MNTDQKKCEWVVNRITDLIKEALKIGTDKMSIGELMTRQDELAGLNALLGTYASEAMQRANMKYFYRKLHYATEWRPMRDQLNNILGKATDKDVDSELVKKLEVEQEAEITAQGDADKLKTLWESNQQVINSWASTIRVKQEMLTYRGA